MMKQILCGLILFFALFSLNATGYLHDEDGRLNTGEFEFLGTTEDFDSFLFFLQFKEYAKGELAKNTPAKTVRETNDLTYNELRLMWNMLKNNGFREGDIYQVWIQNYRHEVYLIVEIRKNDDDFTTIWHAFEVVPLEEGEL